MEENTMAKEHPAALNKSRKNVLWHVHVYIYIYVVYIYIGKKVGINQPPSNKTYIYIRTLIRRKNIPPPGKQHAKQRRKSQTHLLNRETPASSRNLFFLTCCCCCCCGVVVICGCGVVAVWWFVVVVRSQPLCPDALPLLSTGVGRVASSLFSTVRSHRCCWFIPIYWWLVWSRLEVCVCAIISDCWCILVVQFRSHF